MNRQQDFLAAFRHRNFRYYWIASMLVSAGKWMEAVLFGWLVLQMTGSPFLVGVVSACRGVGYGLGPLFGTLADRYDRRNLLLIISSLSALYSFALALLVTMNLVQYWQVIAMALAAGLAHGFDLPLRYAFTSDLVDPRILTNAVALIIVATDVTAVLGPAIAGPLIGVIGVGGVGWLLLINYGFNTLVLVLIRGTARAEKATGGSLFSSLKGGARYIFSRPPIFALLGMAVALNFFQYPQRYALVPVFADQVLKVGAAGYGFLLAASGTGALLGAAAIAYLAELRHKAWVCIVASVSAGMATLAFSGSSWYPLSLGFMAWAGASEAVCMAMMASLLLLLTPHEMRGRVMGARSLAILPLSLGSLLSGAIAGQWGAPMAGMINGVFLISSIVVIVMRVPSLRKSG